MGQAAGDLENGIAHDLPFEAPGIHAPMELVGLVHQGRILSKQALLAIGRGIHQIPVELLDRPAVFHKPKGEMVKKLGVSGQHAHLPKLARAGNDSLPKVPVPDPIHQNPGSKRIVRIGDCPGKFQTTAPARELLVFRTERNDLWKTTINLGSPVIGFAPKEDGGLIWGFLVMENHCPGRGSLRAQKILYLVPDLGHLITLVALEHDRFVQFVEFTVEFLTVHKFANRCVDRILLIVLEGGLEQIPVRMVNLFASGWFSFPQNLSQSRRTLRTTDGLGDKLRHAGIPALLVDLMKE